MPTGAPLHRSPADPVTPRSTGYPAPGRGPSRPASHGTAPMSAPDPGGGSRRTTAGAFGEVCLRLAEGRWGTVSTSELTVVVTECLTHLGMRDDLEQTSTADRQSDGAPDTEAGRGQIHPVRPVVVRLSRREQSVLEALDGTSSRRLIAESQFVSVNTVKTQLRSIYRKVGGASRAGALVRARELGLLPPVAGE